PPARGRAPAQPRARSPPDPAADEPCVPYRSPIQRDRMPRARVKRLHSERGLISCPASPRATRPTPETTIIFPRTAAPLNALDIALALVIVARNAAASPTTKARPRHSQPRCSIYWWAPGRRQAPPSPCCANRYRFEAEPHGKLNVPDVRDH